MRHFRFVGLAVFIISGCIIIIALGLAGYLRVANLTKEQNYFWDIAIKAIGGIIAVIGGGIAVDKFLDEREKENRTALIEAQKPFYTRRQEVYNDLISATSTISNSDINSPKRVKAEASFWYLYWGALPLVADDDVGSATNSFEDALANNLPGEQLRNASMNLARACRRSLGFAQSSDEPESLARTAVSAARRRDDLAED